MAGNNPGPVMRYGMPDDAERPLGRSVKRGLLCRCPNCGDGRLFQAFLKPVDRCAVCGEEIFHHRADDLPPYLVIFILGHLVVGGYMIVDTLHHLPVWATLAIWVPIAAVSALLMMQPVKGAVIGLQWALRMHGFGGSKNRSGDFEDGSGTA